jgi:hypothetical protein
MEATKSLRVGIFDDGIWNLEIEWKRFGAIETFLSVFKLQF